MSTKILHISDLHFGPPFVPAVAEALLQTIPALAPDAIVASGDLTQRAKREQFEECRQFFDRLPDIPLLVIPGNHDVPLYRVFERLFKPLALYCEIIHPDLNPVLQVGNVVLAGLDSTAPHSAISNGRLHRHQLRHCEEVFAAVPEDMTRIVVAHHHFAPGHDKVFDVAMPGSRRAIDCFVEQKVEMILVDTCTDPISETRWTFSRDITVSEGSSSYSVEQPLQAEVRDGNVTRIPST
jgi:3',5'-cyclic AMP phosphodiesterase CpdA